MDDFQIFSESGGSIPANIAEMLGWLMERIDSGDVNPREAVEVLCDIVRPGNSENSHDVKGIWTGAMWAYGYGHVASNIKSMWLNSMPWGIGFAIAVEEGFEFEALSELARNAVIKAMMIVIQIGGLIAEITEDGKIRIDLGDGDFTDVNTTVGEFRKQIDDTLGPDATPKRDDPMKRWMP